MKSITVKFYLTLHYGRRRPTFKIMCNDVEVQVVETQIEHIANKEKIILEFEFPITSNPTQTITFIHYGKTDDDLVIENNQVLIDHYIKIEEVELDDIQLGNNLLYSTVFYHAMPDIWVKDMLELGIKIDPSYAPGTELKLNGRTELSFKTPIWMWWCELLQAYNI